MMIFLYMYVLRAGFRDGRVGLVFCLYHAWYALTVEQLRAERARVGRAPAVPEARPAPALAGAGGRP
jgi:hypothetical protein